MFITWDIYISFVQLRKQLYLLKTQKQIDKYSKIENYIKEYKTFRAFYNSCKSIIDMYEEPPEFSTQDFFDYCLDNTKKLKKSII